MSGRELPKPEDRNALLLTPPGLVAEPQRMMRMPGTGGPGGVDERVVKVLLHIFDDLGRGIARLEVFKRDSREPVDFLVVFRADCG